MADFFKKMTIIMEKDEQFKEGRRQFHQRNGYDEGTASMKANEDYWKMAALRDKVEFFLNE